MGIETRHLEFECDTDCRVDLQRISERLCEITTGINVVRWGIVGRGAGTAIVEYAATRETGDSLTQNTSFAYAVPSSSHVSPAVMIVPTGVGAACGGFIGDASPVARVIESVCGSLITHPNVVNAAALYGGSKNTVYVDGLTLDRFLLGMTSLGTCDRSRRVGIIVDKLSDPDLRF